MGTPLPAGSLGDVPHLQGIGHSHASTSRSGALKARRGTPVAGKANSRADHFPLGAASPTKPSPAGSPAGSGGAEKREEQVRAERCPHGPRRAMPGAGAGGC